MNEPISIKAINMVNILQRGLDAIDSYDPQKVLLICNETDNAALQFEILIRLNQPDIAAPVTTNKKHAKRFLDTFGLEVSRPYLADALWLETYADRIIQADIKAKSMIAEILKERGAVRVATSVQDKEAGLAFIQIFGLKAIEHLPKEIAQQVRGRHLEDELGL